MKKEVDSFLNDTIEKASKLDYQKEGDYLGEDGLLYCGVCKKNKQKRLQFPNNSMRIVKSMCLCEEKAYEERKERDHKEQELHRFRILKQSSLMDSKFYECRFSKFKIIKENQKIYTISTNYVKNFDEMYKNNQGLLLYGEVGSGKSWDAACIANELLDIGISVIMTSFTKILRDLEKEDIEKVTYIECLTNASLLIIDDLGAERDTSYALEQVYDVIDSRYRIKKPLILTTNLTIKEMQQCDDIRYKRIYDRVFEMCYPVYFPDIKWRYKEAGNRFDKMKKMLEG